jgi:flavorubredoxin
MTARAADHHLRWCRHHLVRTPRPVGPRDLLNPGQSLDVGDRQLTALRPPLFDNPSTVGWFDDRSGSYFSSDCFGASMETAELATADDIGYCPPSAVRAAQHLWATVDSPWVHTVNQAKFMATM